MILIASIQHQAHQAHHAHHAHHETSSKLQPTKIQLPQVQPTKTLPILHMDGFFFKFGRSTMPKLELPLPDKLPRFELGAG